MFCMKTKIFLLGFLVGVLFCTILAGWNSIHPLNLSFRIAPQKNTLGLDTDSMGDIEVIANANGPQGSQPCPPGLANAISNTNLFSLEEQQLIKSIPAIFGSNAPYSGPAGTAVVHPSWSKRWFDRGNMVFQFTNLELKDKVWFDQYGYPETHHVRDSAGNGFDLIFDGMERDPQKNHGDSPQFSLSQFKHGVQDGIQVVILGEHCVRWLRFSNGLAIDQWLYWSPDGSQLDIWVKFKKPYDYLEHSKKRIP